MPLNAWQMTHGSFLSSCTLDATQSSGKRQQRALRPKSIARWMARSRFSSPEIRQFVKCRTACNPKRVPPPLDRKINRGNRWAFPDVVNRIAKSHGCATLGNIRLYEKEIVLAMRYLVDFLKTGDLEQPADSPADKNDPRVTCSQDPGRGGRSAHSLPSRAAKPHSKRGGNMPGRKANAAS